jgi:hypothetical protein
MDTTTPVLTPQTFGLIAFVAAVVWLPTLAVAAMYFFRRLESMERLKAIELGATVGIEPAIAALASRKSGIVLIAAAAGIVAADLILVAVSRDPQALVFMALAVIPLFIGIGLLIDYRLTMRNAAAASTPANRDARQSGERS